MGPSDRLQVTADVTNTGAMAGDEIVQLYVSYRRSRVQRAPKEPSKRSRACISSRARRAALPLEIAAANLAYWDVKTGGWQVEPIEYGVHVGVVLARPAPQGPVQDRAGRMRGDAPAAPLGQDRVPCRRPSAPPGPTTPRPFTG